MKPQPNKKLHHIAIEDKLRYTLEDILNDITEYSVKGDIDYFLDCWKTIIEFALAYRGGDDE